MLIERDAVTGEIIRYPLPYARSWMGRLVCRLWGHMPWIRVGGFGVTYERGVLMVDVWQCPRCGDDTVWTTAAEGHRAAP